MANQSVGKVIVMCGRNVGVFHPNNNQLRVGGIYTPAHANAKGKQVSAKWNSIIAINHRDYIDAAGNTVKARTQYLKVTAWSGKASNGNGMAEILSRCMSIGLEVCFEADVNQYDSDIYKDGVRLMNADGTPFQMVKTEYVMLPRTFLIVGESNEHISKEIASGARPQFWNVKIHGDSQIWENIMKTRRAERYQPGKTTYGYAVVGTPKGAQPNAYAQAPTLALPTQPLVKGYTYDQWKEKNPNFDQIAMTHPDFAAFVPLIQARLVAGNLAAPTAPVMTTPTVVNTPPVTTAFNMPY